MATPEDRGDLWTLLNVIRREIAQNRTDIQRLWKLQQRFINEPYYIVGGDRDDGGSGGSGETTPPFTSSGLGASPEPPLPGGGADPDDEVQSDCCLWRWDGSAWVKIIDRTTDCECPEPTTPGEYFFEERGTCCPPPSTSEGCIPCASCCIPETITATVSYNGAGGTSAGCQDILGGHTMSWNGTYWEGSCEGPQASDGAYLSAKWKASIYSQVGGICQIFVARYIYTEAACGGLEVQGVSTIVTIEDCDPLFGDVANYCNGNYTLTLTE